MMKLTRVLGFAAALVSIPVAAQEPEPDTTYNFEDHAVEGDYRSPLGEILRSRTRMHRTSLIRPRGHFVPELVKSIERL